MTKAHLVLRFDAPLMAFGGVIVDNYGRTDAFPSASLLAGLIGNALGYDRCEGDRLQALQDRLIHAVSIDQPGTPIMDFQTAALEKNDKGWTTRGKPEGRAGGAGTYAGKHIRYRDFWADRIVHIALRLEPAHLEPDLDAVSAALDSPARPLFIGRKPCLPSAPILAGRVSAHSALAAIEEFGREHDQSPCEMFWPEADNDGRPSVRFEVYGERNWVSGVHGGTQRWRRGMIREAGGQ